MATYTAQDDAIILLDNTAGSLTDISDYVKSLSFDITQIIARFPVLGQRWKKTSVGTSEAKGTATFYTSKDTAGPHYFITYDQLNAPTLKPASKTLRIQDPDAASGSFQFDMEVYTSSYNEVTKAAGEANPGEHKWDYEIDANPVLTVIA